MGQSVAGDQSLERGEDPFSARGSKKTTEKNGP